MEYGAVEFGPPGSLQYRKFLLDSRRLPGPSNPAPNPAPATNSAANTTNSKSGRSSTRNGGAALPDEAAAGAPQTPKGKAKRGGKFASPLSPPSSPLGATAQDLVIVPLSPWHQVPLLLSASAALPPPADAAASNAGRAFNTADASNAATALQTGLHAGSLNNSRLASVGVTFFPPLRAAAPAAGPAASAATSSANPTEPPAGDAGGLFRMVCAVPRGTWAQVELAVAESPHHPLRVRGVNDLPSHYSHNLRWNVGFLPQTCRCFDTNEFDSSSSSDGDRGGSGCGGGGGGGGCGFPLRERETTSPSAEMAEKRTFGGSVTCGGAHGPLEVVDIGEARAEAGQVYLVKALAAFLVVSPNLNTHWTVIVTSDDVGAKGWFRESTGCDANERDENPKAGEACDEACDDDRCPDEDDRRAKGLEEIREWLKFRGCLSPLDLPCTISFREKPVPLDRTIAMINGAHAAWKGAHGAAVMPHQRQQQQQQQQRSPPQQNQRQIQPEGMLISELRRSVERTCGSSLERHVAGSVVCVPLSEPEGAKEIVKRAAGSLLPGAAAAALAAAGVREGGGGGEEEKEEEKGGERGRGKSQKGGYLLGSITLGLLPPQCS
ncbi:hypothetical protein CLOP_g24773 [Closterium sp. NIES-67]|nr:hypothetical protein CLOP_g24773 [Closterium sp. NIES-67]